MDASNVSPVELQRELVSAAAPLLVDVRARADDHEMLRDGLVLYDALYLWAKEGLQETHAWNPALYR